MRNVVPARSLTRRSRLVLFGALTLILLGALAITVHFFMVTVSLVVPSNPNYDFYITVRDALLWLGILLIVLGIGLGIRSLTWKKDNLLALAIGDALGNFLDDRYVYIRNLSRFAVGYVDAVLVGPAGVLVFRITQRGGIYFNEGANWMIQKDKGQWRTLQWSPTKEVVDDVKKIRQFLQTRGLSDVPVFGVVVFTQDAPQTMVTTESPVVPVLQPFELQYGLEDTYFSKKDRLDQLVANKVATLLYG